MLAAALVRCKTAALLYHLSGMPRSEVDGCCGIRTRRLAFGKGNGVDSLAYLEAHLLENELIHIVSDFIGAEEGFGDKNACFRGLNAEDVSVAHALPHVALQIPIYHITSVVWAPDIERRQFDRSVQAIRHEEFLLSARLCRAVGQADWSGRERRLLAVEIDREQPRLEHAGSIVHHQRWHA